MTDADATAVLEAHGPFLSDLDEEEIIRRIAVTEDVADLALRTCMCGQRLDGFDEYFAHLRAVVRGPATGAEEHP